MAELTFSTFDCKPIPFENHYTNKSCFLVLSGPSLNQHDLTKLKQPGVISFGVNNSAKTFRPNLWTCVDHPSRFIISVWKDPNITKFVPFFKAKSNLFDNANWKDTDLRVMDCPNVVYYHRNEKFNSKSFLTEKTINWGNSKQNGGGRSVMMAAMKICYLLGFKNVFLLGCDFKMEKGQQNYSWKQDRHAGSVRGNNSTYNKMIDRYTQLRPIFEENDFHVFNCNPDSQLEVFPFINFEEAVEMSLKDFPDVETERAEGMYDRFDAEEKKKKEKKKMRKIENIKKVEKPIAGSKGVIYYNVGKGAIVRLAVSLLTCVRHYSSKQITILSDYEGYDDCKEMAKYFGVNIKLIELEKLDKKEVLLNKCLAHTYTPYDNTIFIDADTLILNSFDELHDAADKDEFVVTQFSDWTTKRSVIRKRIKEWKSIFPEMVEPALQERPSVNVGVYAFKKDSELMNAWFDYAKHGTHMFIPDEQCCHLLLPKFKNRIVSNDYNTSCKYDKITNNTKILHFHGRKHCRLDEEGNYVFNSDKWYFEFDKIKDLNFMKNNIQHDRQLRKYLPRRAL